MQDYFICTYTYYMYMQCNILHIQGMIIRSLSRNRKPCLLIVFDFAAKNGVKHGSFLRRQSTQDAQVIDILMIVCEKCGVQFRNFIIMIVQTQFLFQVFHGDSYMNLCESCSLLPSAVHRFHNGDSWQGEISPPPNPFNPRIL